MRSNSLAVIALGTILAGSATASPMFVATSGQTLYRFDLSGNVESFNLGREFNGAATDSKGQIWLTEKHDIDGDGFRSLERIDNAALSISLTHIGDFLEGPSAAVTFINDELHAFQRVGQPGRALVRIDPNQAESVRIGATGMVDLLPSAGAFDPVSGTLYATTVIEATSSRTYAVDYLVSPSEDPTAALVGPTGTQTQAAGSEWFAGTMYHAAMFADGQGAWDLRFGSIDPTTGQWTHLSTVASGIALGDVSLAVVPAPASAGVLALGGVLAGRRRR